MATPARADRISVDELLRLAKEGRLRLPSFQRALRWDPDDKWKLLDSMERGYPIGTLLLWKRPASAADLGAPLPRGPTPPTQGDLQLVVDGQQRITTLWEALALEPEGAQPTVLYDMANERFVVRALKRSERGPTAVAGDASSVPALPLFVALDAVTLGEWIPSTLPREIKVRYHEIGKRLREYLVPIYVVEGDDIEVLRNVFDRTNSTGKPLTRDEVFDALVGSRIAPDGGLRLVHAQLADLGFGSIDRATILKSFEAIRGERIGKLDPRSLDPRVAESDLLSTARALRRAIAFLQSIGVPHVATLPYELPLVVLARFFRLYDTPDERSLVLLKRWFWRGAANGRHDGASGSLQQHVDDVSPEAGDGSVHRLLDRTGDALMHHLEPDPLDDLSIASPRGKVMLCALFAHAPRSLRTGDRLTAGELFGDATDEVTLRIVRPGDSVLGSTIGNRLLHPAVGVAASRLVLECRDEGALASHGIGRTTLRLLREGDVDTFLEHRSTRFLEWLRAFVDERAEWGRADRPSIRSLAGRRDEKAP